MVDLLPSSEIFNALSKKKDHGNNTFHEVAKTEQVETAEFLVTKIMAANGQDGVRRIHLVKELLEDRNQLGETPLYGAVALGQTKMAKFLAKKVGHISKHFQRNDGVSILHIAVIGQHFGLSISLSMHFDYFQNIETLIHKLFIIYTLTCSIFDYRHRYIWLLEY